MSLFREIEQLKAQIIDSEHLLEMVLDHPMMAEGLKQKLYELKTRLNDLPKEVFEPKIQLLFSGNAVMGSQGIKSSFLSQTLNPFQEIVKTQAALIRFGHVGKRGQAKKSANTELYLTALPIGSFGVELSQLESYDLFDSQDVSKAMKSAIFLINDVSLDDSTFEKAIINTPKRNLSNLKRFLKEIVEEDSIVEMECGEIGIEISKEKVKEAYERVSETTDNEEDLIINGIFRGLLLDSGKFEVQDAEGRKISGFLSEELVETELVKYDQAFLNRSCRIYLRMHKTKFKTGNERIDYELLEIK